ncbi:MAG TPA: type I 3-dehydroquinate dehydratase [Pyrinomonadaceae bacterium]|jgi:3-dehydroquinate dehydratase/shikimate dehydrogenase|nr:type I 3-dehydroquinate dehydratase [Pyrinomonadaceae bacterium]
MPPTSLIATLLDPPSPDGAELTALSDAVEWLEVRADVVGDIDPDWLRSHFKGRLLYALRTDGELLNRPQRLKTAARFYDRVELEAETDLSEELLQLIPAEKRLVSWYGSINNQLQLSDRFSQLTSVAAGVYKIVTNAATIAEEFLPLSLLKSLKRTDTIAFSNGPLGFWNRLIALHVGAPATFGLVAGGSVAAMEPTISKLIADYGLPEVTPAKELFAIIGNPIFHSLSPRLHNASYRAMEHPALFVPLRVESFEEFWREFVVSRKLDEFGMPINGMTVASPHKEEAVLRAIQVSEMVRQTEAANILVRNNGWWIADTTDPDVVYTASRDRSVSVREKRAAVIGCGGAGRAIAAALVESGAGVTLINRGAERGEHAAALLGLPYIPLRDFNAEGYDIVVNATPVGRDTDEAPFELETMNDDAVVIDLVYGARPTPLVGTTRARQQVAIDGRDVLVTQVRHQFRLMTGKEMSVALAREKLL